jgi:lipopolysaccharide export system permease protein
LFSNVFHWSAARAIIRKGGLGLPIVFAILILSLSFHKYFGKRLAQEKWNDTFMGSWLSSFILTPLAVLFNL